jgi:predicted phosphodiesterase
MLKRLAVALCLLAVAATLPGGADSQEPQAAFGIAHGPYLQVPGTSSVTVAWHTNRPAVSRVEYGPTEALGRVAVSAEHGLIDNHRTSHVVRLSALPPGKPCFYRVVSREFLGYDKQHIVRWGETATSEVRSFTTLDTAAGDYTFTMVSDIHENVARFEALLAGVEWERTPLVVFNGDMVNDFMTEGQPFAGFLDAAVRLFGTTRPFVYVRGNHDVRGRFARRLDEYFPTSDGRAYYSFDHGPVHFVVLDSGEDKVDGHEYYNGLVAFEPYRREQAEWLARDLASASARRARFRVILSHIPPRGGKGFAIDEVRRLWEPVANGGRVDLWMSGHTHRVANVAPAAGENAYRLIVNAPDTLVRVSERRDRLEASVIKETGEEVTSAVVRRRGGGRAR